MSFKSYRASILHFPQETLAPQDQHVYIKDGLLVTHNGKIHAVGPYQTLQAEYPEAELSDHRGSLLVPGFIDSHLHFPQAEMIASYGEQLLEWLENYTFPTEQKFADPEYATKIAEVFLQQLLRNGTTTAMVYSSVHKEATDCLFRAAQLKNMCLVAGKVCMDRNCPEELQDSPESAQKDSDDLIRKWHGKDRLMYALTPRFAPTSSTEQMHALSELAQQYPDVFIQTHLSENTHEIAWVKSLYPGFEHYLDVYHRFGMVRPRAVFGHCLHLEPSEWKLLSDTGASIAFCPTSNLFLGSGLFDYDTAKTHNVRVTLATDVGAGTSFNMLRTLGEAYKVCQLKNTKLSPLEGLYMMTQGSAVSLGLERQIGNLNPGTDADFVILDPHFDPLSRLRINPEQHAVEDVIFALSMLADDRAVVGTWVAGQAVYQRAKEYAHGVV